ncbi:hypothetical protein OESDEN_08587 [Oesophagostomum dentatum]|uniref:Uncharacterized protein n=1 Tax=Oesophagostomum dentatum TaxID=61180 RepID=A0A0B1T5X4_OESDE|nr:hypothetical protein OESDEN_08587 [Oesophagostomum dentatum]
MESSSKAFTIACVNSDDELKLIALLMILCTVDSVDIEAGSDDEVQMGSSVLYEATPFVFDGSTIKSCSEEQSKLRLSAKAEPWAMHLLAMRKSAKRLIRKDERSVVLVYVKKIKHSMKKQEGSLSTSLTSAPEGVAHDENDAEGEIIAESLT